MEWKESANDSLTAQELSKWQCVGEVKRILIRTFTAEYTVLPFKIKRKQLKNEKQNIKG